MALPRTFIETARWKGLGDVIAAATKAVGIKPCSACKKRQDALNRAIPFPVKPVDKTP